MLKGDPEPRDLKAAADRLLAEVAPAVDALRRDFGETAVTPTPSDTVAIRYPVLEYPGSVRSLSLDKTPEIRDRLIGIKGQYLIFEAGVLNVRKFTSYEVILDV